MADLITLENLKSYLWPGESITTWDAILPAIISAVSAQVRKEVGCEIEYAFYPAAPGPTFVVSALNNKIDFSEGVGDLVGTVVSGTYNPADLASAIAAAMNAAPGKGETYSCVYSAVTRKFTISATAAISILWNTGANKAVSIADLIGFPDDADSTGAETYAGRMVTEAAWIGGSGTSALALPNWPIRKAVLVTDQAGTEFEAGYDKDFVVEPFCLRRTAGVWTRGVSNYFVAYQAGYDEIPADIALVCYELAARKWKTMREQGWGESGRTMPDGSTSVVNADAALTKAQKDVLAKYRRLSL